MWTLEWEARREKNVLSDGLQQGCTAKGREPKVEPAAMSVACKRQDREIDVVNLYVCCEYETRKQKGAVNKR